MPKTMERLRGDVADWTLADDVGLMVVLEEVAATLKTKVLQVEREVDALSHDTSTVHVALRNAFTSFSMLSHTQFVENRVYDTDDQVLPPRSACECVCLCVCARAGLCESLPVNVSVGVDVGVCACMDR